MLLTALIPSNKVAQWLLVHIHHLLDLIGLEKDQTIEEIIYVAIIVCIALFLGWAIKSIVLYALRKFMLVRHSVVGKELISHHVLSRCSHIIPPLVLLALLPFAFTEENAIQTILFRALLVYTVLVVCRAICTVTSFIWLRFDQTRNSKNLPLRGILDTTLGIIWFIAIIISISIVVNKSPVNLFTGLGAFAAVLMLVFKDSILGLVAGLQLSQNDMLRVGDWIVVPSTIANGIVTDVTLTAVKVQNWDNTIVTLPPLYPHLDILPELARNEGQRMPPDRTLSHHRLRHNHAYNSRHDSYAQSQVSHHERLSEKDRDPRPSRL